MFLSKKKGDKMNIAPVSMSNYNCSPADKKISFQAMKLGGVTVSDEAGKAINKLVETLNEIPRQRAKYIDISLGNSRAHETQFQRPYYEIKAGDKASINTMIKIDNSGIENAFVVNTEKNKEGKDIVKSFRFYPGRTLSVPNIKYWEKEVGNVFSGVNAEYKKGDIVADGVSASIANLINTVLGKMGIK